MKGGALIRLGDCCEIVSGGTPSTTNKEYWGGKIAWATPKDLSNLGSKYLYATPESLTDAGYRSCSAKLLPAQSVLFSSRAPIGHVAINTIPMCTNQGFKSFVPDPERVSVDFLYHWLKHKKTYLQSLGNGATFKEVSKATVSDVKIELPPLLEQRRIAEILDKADTLRAKRREAIAKLAQLLQAVFLEMFGDPVSNSKNWPRVRLGDLLDSIDSGKSPVCLDRPAHDGEWAVLKLGAVTKCNFVSAENKALPPGIQPDKRWEVKSGDLLFSRKNTKELVAACVLVRGAPPRLLLPDLIFRLVMKPGAFVLPEYLQSLFVHDRKRKEIQSLAGGAAGSMPNISKAKLLEVLVELPPIELQRKYAQARASIEILKEEADGALDSLEYLFRALQKQLLSAK